MNTNKELKFTNQDENFIYGFQCGKIFEQCKNGIHPYISLVFVKNIEQFSRMADFFDCDIYAENENNNVYCNITFISRDKLKLGSRVAHLIHPEKIKYPYGIIVEVNDYSIRCTVSNDEIKWFDKKEVCLYNAS